MDTSRKKTSSVKSGAKESDASIKSLNQSISKLASGLDVLQATFQKFSAGNIDMAKSVADLALDAKDVKQTFNTLSDISTAINTTTSDAIRNNEKLLKLNKLSLNFEQLTASVIQESLDNQVNTSLEQNSISERYAKLLALQKNIQGEIDELQKSKVGLSKEDQEVIETQIKLSADQLDKLSGILDKEKALVAEAKKLTKEQEKQKIVQESINGVTEKFKGTLGESSEEIFEIGHAIKKSMTSPMALFGALVGSALEEFGKIGKTSREFLNTTGLTVDQTEHLRHEAHDLSLELRDQGVQMKDVFDAQSALLNQFGSINRVSDETTKTVVQLGKAFGVAAENSAGVIYNMQKATGVSAEVAGNVAALGADFAKAAGVAPNEVFKDIANSSEQIAQYFKGTPADLMRTAVEARRLGLSIAKVADISKALLSFESSIEDQMTASVLLGREINLDKARQLAMEGKIQEAAEETLKQVGSLADFNKMNAVQKEAIAKAAGMTVGDLQQSLEKQEAIKNMTAEQRAEYEKGLAALKGQNMSAAEKLLQDQKNQLTQEKIADAVAKISEIFANVILPVLEPIFDLISGIFSVISPALPLLKTALQIFLGWKVAMFAISKIRLIDFKALGNGLKGLFTGDTWKAGWKKMTGFITTDWKKATGKLPAPEIEKKPGGFFGSIKDKISNIFGKKETPSAVTDKSKELMDKVGEDKYAAYKEARAKGMKPADAAAAAKEKIADVKPAAGAVDKTADATKKGISADKETGGSKAGEGIKTFFTNLAEGLKAMGQSGVGKGVFNTLVAGPALLIFTAAAPGLFVLSRFGKGIEGGLKSLANGLKAMGDPAVALGAGILSIVALSLGAGMLMLGVGVYFAAKGMAELAAQFKEMEPGQILATAAAFIGFGVAINLLAIAGAAATAGALGLIVITGVIFGLAKAINIAAPAIETVSNSLQTLVSNVGADSLFSIGAGLMSVAAGLGAVGLAGAIALPTLTGLALLTPALKVLDSIFGDSSAESKPASKPAAGTEEEKPESPSADTQLLLDKMDQLISAITSAGEIKLDAKKVGEVLAINTVRNYKISS